MSRTRFHTLKIAAVEATTADAVVLHFDIPDHLKPDFGFVPGQYLTLRTMHQGAEVRRSYSICSSLDDPRIAVGIKRIPGGAFSTLAQTLKVGNTLDVVPPQGRFTAPIGGQHSYLLLAAGSGITPILSIARSVLAGEPDSIVTLCYANRTSDATMFRQDIDDLKDSYMTRFLLTHVMDEEAQDIELFNGRLDAEKLHTMATRGLITPLAYDAIYVCGPEPMITSATKALRALGIPDDRIRFELFTPSTPLRTAGPATKPPTSSKQATVEVVLDGTSRRFPMLPGDTLIEAATQAGLDLPYSCANGMCATCRCKLVGGAAEMTQNFSLETWELEAGYMLACQVQPKSDKVILDFDAV